MIFAAFDLSPFTLCAYSDFFTLVTATATFGPFFQTDSRLRQVSPRRTFTTHVADFKDRR